MNLDQRSITFQATPELSSTILKRNTHSREGLSASLLPEELTVEVSDEAVSVTFDYFVSEKVSRRRLQRGDVTVRTGAFTGKVLSARIERECQTEGVSQRPCVVNALKGIVAALEALRDQQPELNHQRSMSLLTTVLRDVVIPAFRIDRAH